MLNYEITRPDSQVTVIVQDEESVFDRIWDITGDERTAIEVSSWADLACVGETYQHDLFNLTAIEA